MERQSKFKKMRWSIILGLAFLMLAASGTWAMAETSAAINACVVPSTGAIRIVTDPLKGTILKIDAENQTTNQG